MKNIVFKLKVKFAKNSKKRAKYLSKYINMGKNCEVYSNVNFGSEPYLISIGNNVKITNNVQFCTHDGGMHVLRNLEIEPNADYFGKIKIGDNVFVGWNSIIMPNVTIGNNIVIGAGSIVTRDIEDNTVVAGIPAKKICSIEEYYKKHKESIDITKNMDANEKKIFLVNKYCCE